MAHTTLKVGILIVSTTAAEDPSTDDSGPLLSDLFAAHTTPALTWEVSNTLIVPDSTSAILETLLRWTGTYGGEKMNLIVTTGGTGFAVTDETPEAVRGILTKVAPGLVHAMLSASLAITPFAMMSRPVAGVRGHTVIVTLPGSPKGAKENLEALIKLLPHACIQAGGLSSSRALHSGGTAALEARAGLQPQPHTHTHAHTHHHHHAAPRPHTANDLNGPVTRRHRESPYPMLTVPDATALIARETALNDTLDYPVNAGLVGHVLAEDVTAAESVPAFRASIVDGYAVIHTDGPGDYPVVSVSHAAPASSESTLAPGQIARITTGAPLPAGATAVVMVEDTTLLRATPDGAEELEVRVHASSLAAGENVREPGSDVAAGARVLSKGDVVSAVGGEIGVLASVGRAAVKVYRKPVVAVLSTGDEVVAHDREGPLRTGEIRDSNRPALISAIAAAGFEALDMGIAADTAGALERVLREALERADVVITTGGVSMGERDLLKPTIEQALGGTIHFGRVAMKPGKPTTFATVPGGEAGADEKKSKKKLLFALPGNPASALVTFHLFVLPALRRAAGRAPAELPVVRVRLAQDVALDARPEYHRVWIAAGAADGRLRAWSTGGQRSSRVGSARGANGVLVLPARGECGGKRGELGVVPAGEVVDAILWGVLGMAASDGV